MPEPDNEDKNWVRSGFGHNFADVQVVRPSFGQSRSLAVSESLHCPSIGTWRTCAARVQAKLKINEPGDKFEQEADRVAEQVMRMPGPQVQRKSCSLCNDIDEEEQIQTKPVVGQLTPLIQRQESEPEEEEEEEVVQTKLLVHRQESEPEEEEDEEILQPKEVPGQTPAVTKDVQKNVNSLRGTGKPLPESERSLFESRFGLDFGRVRIHTGEQAAQLTRSVNARAFTAGRNVVFGADRFAPDTVVGCQLLAHELTHVVQQESRGPRIQRQPMTAPQTVRSSPEERIPTTEEQVTSSLIVENDVTTLESGQMRKKDFLAQLRNRATGAADAAMARTGRTTADCPYLDYWFSYYENQNSARIEPALHRYAPETRDATTAEQYITIATERVRRAARTWAEAGRITRVPQWILAAAPGGAPAESGEGTEASTAPVMAKVREGGVRSADNPRAIRAELGQGRPLDGGVRSRMQSAFGRDFSHVRTHTDPTAARLSNRLNARAFTVGKHVAFGSGEYRPGTMLGEALIAHEMAHVVQQGDASAGAAPMQTGGSSYNILENDADKSAVGALVSLWCGAKGKLASIAKNVMPRVRSGLCLSRCGRSWGVSKITVYPKRTKPEFVNDVITDLNSLYATVQGGALLDEFISKNWSVSIECGPHHYVGGEIEYTPWKRVEQGCERRSIPSWTSETWHDVPSWVYLFHELVHAYDDQTGHGGETSVIECRAVGLGEHYDTEYNENRLRCECDMPIRPCYAKATAQPCATAKIPGTDVYDAPICRAGELVRATREDHEKMK